jgi:hypothetical protein
MDSAEDVIHTVEEAFARVSRGKITLHEALVIDAYGDERRRKRARKRDPEQGWRDIPGSVLEECYSALSFLDPRSWRFYLPAFICWGLSTGRLIHEAVYSLGPSLGGEIGPAQLKRFQALTPAQIEAVRRFLEFVVMSDRLLGRAAEDALEAYWSEPDGGKT